jgi:import inner membrane translocase subunit TIM44
MKSRPVFLRTLRLRNTPTSALLARPSLLSPPSTLAASRTSFRALSTSSRLLNETKQQEQQQKQTEGNTKNPPPKQEDNAPPQSPWKVFVNTLKEEIEKNQGWQDNVKQLQGEVDKAADSEAMKRARALYEKTRVSGARLRVRNPELETGCGQRRQILGRSVLAGNEARGQGETRVRSARGYTADILAGCPRSSAASPHFPSTATVFPTAANVRSPR